VRGIYTIRHAKTGRVYVGKSNGVDVRWRQHRHDLDCGRHINAGLQAD
jgi:Straboviridae intron-associated endonuclease 1